ncbi:flagellar biosynthesis protein FlhF [Pseudomethylobacillus aquaticus]|uniref:Flagellar biosynthesis protein FlhF n=1 Tax=Pseudomethylobacillus aquaticus TaxID=2676064 RepID=A0A3N0V0V0_9PROT|nr:flagellar biosynthesis protein FlhF [Pseudomethylobacillus aquaticus]ROH86151.1 flagellar biosynthesis protein FlhF [Pseudomethylobacillus aquaticus]
MSIKRYFAATSRQAMGLVREELGEDAIILANRRVDGGNEILAMRDQDVSRMVAQPAATPAASSVATPADLMPAMQQAPQADEPQTLMSLLNQRRQSSHQASIDPAISNPASIVRPLRDGRVIPSTAPRMPQAVLAQAAAPAALASAGPLASASPVAQPTASAAAPTGSPLEIARVMDEIRAMRHTIESQLTELHWEHAHRQQPAKSGLLKRLLGSGFSASFARLIADKLPAGHDDAQALEWARNTLLRNLNTLDSEQEMLDQGGVYALIGPTGVGKTTTTAKLAARYVMKHGTQKLALITTDGYRIGGHEQLRIYGKILGVMVHAVKDETDLKLALEELRGKHTILIDTVGVSQRDQMVAEQIAMLRNADSSIKRILCLNATCGGETLMDVVSAYRGQGAQRQIDGCIITKLDEAASLGSALDIVIRERLKLYFVCNGQRVPEDIALADRDQLVDMVLNSRPRFSRPFELLDDELPLVMAAQGQAPQQHTEVRHV